MTADPKHTKRDGREFLDHVEDSLAADALSPTTPLGDVSDALREAGADPDAIAAAGAALANKLAAERELPWMARARARLAEARDRMVQTAAKYADYTRGQLLARLDELRVHPALEEPVTAAFRKRSPAESSDDELRELVGDFESLIAVAEQGAADRSGDE